ncbi:L-lactate permease [Micromonospora sp. NPDC000442]|uniref:L-lactate permease n=1 Tax=Micromonospora sp. NPDC000442 TaxID=3364217 RepID=UPI0036C3EA37
MPETTLPINLGTWLLAISPILLLLLLLAVLRWKAPQAGPVGMFLAVAVAVLFFRTPWESVAVGAGKGVWDAVFILLVIWPALLLYRIGTASGAFDALRRGLSRYSRNHVFLVLAFGWVFASFMQGIAGFGAPIAIVAPLLLAIGVRAVYAVVIPLIGHAWANMFGTLAVGWLATLQVVDLEDELTTTLITAALLAPVTLMAGAAIAWMAGKGPALRLAWPFILIISAIHGGLQFVIMYWEPVLSTFLAATVALVALYPLSRWSRYREPARSVPDRPAMKPEAGETAEDEDEHAPTMSLSWALLPYAVLTAVAVFTLAVPPVEAALDRIEFGLPFPEADTGYDVVTEAEQPYSAIAPFTHPGFSLIVAVLVTWLVFRARGFFAARAERQGRQPVWSSLAADATPASVAILSFLILAGVMEHSGQTDLLAQGIEQISPPLLYAFAANLIGLIGAFMTSSNTASNVLFGQLQQGVASGTGLSESAVIGAQSAGGAIGNAIAPANIVLGTGTAGIVGQEGAVLRKTLPWTLTAAVVIGLLTLLFV